MKALRLKLCFMAAVLALAGSHALATADFSHAEEAVDTVASVSQRITARLGELKDDGLKNDAGAASLAALAHDLEVLRDKSIMVFGERRKRWEEANAQLAAALTDWSGALNAADGPKAREAGAAFRGAWKRLQAEYPAEALEPLPALWTCPMHPEVMVRDAGSCPSCGMPLEPIYETQPQLSRDPLIGAEIVADQALSVGSPANLSIKLSFLDGGEPVTLDDLEEAHTRKIHLLIIDLSETDYHHVHPEPVVPGEYAFSFTPLRPGPYRLWADLKPVRTHIQQYAVADIPALVAHAEMAGDEPENRDAEAGGYSFHLAFEKPVIRAKETVRGRLHVADAQGKPFERLQVVMGAFGHFVGFRQYSSVLHVHPLGPPQEATDALGGPDLDFYFRSEEEGLIRLFTQVKIGDRDIFPRFVVNVRPRPKLLGE